MKRLHVVGWNAGLGVRTVSDMPKLRDEDVQFAKRLGDVLVQLRNEAGWTQEEAAEEAGVTARSLGRWERGENPPKGYDLGRLFNAYERWGADWRWFFDPPETVRVDPVRARLDAAERSGAIALDERNARIAARRQRAVEKRAASRDKSAKRARPRQPRPERSR